MRECFDGDDLVALSEALEPDVAAGLAHLQSCARCREELIGLVEVQRALREGEQVSEAVLQSVRASVRTEALQERRVPGSPRAAALALEAVLAGLTGPALMFASGVRPGLAAIGILSASCAAAVLMTRRFERARVGAAA